jgi:hypothetical protein
MQIGGEGLPENKQPATHSMPEISKLASHETNKGREIRREIFSESEESSSRRVDASILDKWVDNTKTTSSSSGEYFAATKHPDGDYQESNKFKRLRLDSDGFLCLKHFSEEDNHSQAKPHLNQDEFERLFSKIDADVRADSLVEPNIARLWEYVLSGKSHSTPKSIK